MNLATHAQKLDRVSKPVLQKMLLDYHKKNIDSCDAELTKLLAACYKNFMPATAGKKSTPEAWVHSAISKEAVRPYLTHSYSRGGYLYATDGHRLHWIPTALEEGYYDSNGQPVALDGTFPECERVIPSGPHRAFYKTLDQLKETLDTEGKACIFTLGDCQYKLNKMYLEAAFNGCKLEARIKASVHKGKQCNKTPLLFEFADGTRKAVIMSIRI